VGYVPGDVRHYPWLTARKALRLVGQVRGLDLRDAGHELAQRFDLEVGLPVRKMSRGNRQKLALVLALVHQPQLVILDEPTSGLDPLMQHVLADCLRELATNGHTVFFSSHTISEVESLCDRVSIIRNGRIVVDDRIDDLKCRAPRTVTVSFRSPEDAQAVAWPEFLTLRRHSAADCELELTGSAVPFAHWVATQPIVDVTIGPPSLETLFRGYYRDDSEDL
jgi:ABC-2 type transport system ATP-binding protein